MQFLAVSFFCIEIRVFADILLETYSIQNYTPTIDTFCCRLHFKYRLKRDVCVSKTKTANTAPLSLLLNRLRGKLCVTCSTAQLSLMYTTHHYVIVTHGHGAHGRRRAWRRNMVMNSVASSLSFRGYMQVEQPIAQAYPSVSIAPCHSATWNSRTVLF